MPFDRITIDAAKMGGVPCIRGLRIPVATVVDMLASGMAAEDILADFPEKPAQLMLCYCMEVDYTGAFHKYIGTKNLWVFNKLLKGSMLFH